MSGRSRKTDGKAGPSDKMVLAYYESPIGLIEIGGHGARASCPWISSDGAKVKAWPAAPLLKECLQQIDEYFRGRSEGILPCPRPPRDGFPESGLAGTPQGPLRQDRPPTGRSPGPWETGRRRAPSAGANHRNPVSIIVPCHRVLGADGNLIGYGGGLWRKEWLLAHERKHA